MGTSHTAQRLIAAMIASSFILGGSWVAAAQATPTADTPCADAIRLAENIYASSDDLAGTTAARSAALRLGMDAKVATLTPEVQALADEVYMQRQAFNAAVAACN